MRCVRGELGYECLGHAGSDGFCLDARHGTNDEKGKVR